MQWTDRIRQVKIILVIAAIVIAVASLVVSNYLVRDLSREERQNMEVWAEAMRALSTADENTDLNLALKVLAGNNTIPVVVKDKEGNVIDNRNIKDTLDISHIAEHSDYIRIYLDDELLNEIDLSQAVNTSADGVNPFHRPQYILLNLAMGGDNGGDVFLEDPPLRYEVDYVRVYQKK